MSSSRTEWAGLRHDLQPGERIAAGWAVTSDPSRWGVAVLLAVALALTAASLVSLLGPLNASPVIVLALPGLGLGMQFLPRPMYVAVTDRRLICIRISRLHGKLGRPAFAVPFAAPRVLNNRSGKYSTFLLGVGVINEQEWRMARWKTRAFLSELRWRERYRPSHRRVRQGCRSGRRSGLLAGVVAPGGVRAVGDAWLGGPWLIAGQP